MMKTVLIISGFYVIPFCLFCLLGRPQSANPAERVEKDRGQVTAVEVVRARFGSGPDDIGIVTPKEANPEGPVSFALGSGGNIYVLDQINSRIQVFKEGKRIRSIPIPFKTVMDIDVLPDGKIVLLDNLVKKAACFLEPGGKVIHHVPLVGENVPYAPEVEGIYTIYGSDLAGIWLDLGNRSVRVASLEGKPFSSRILVSGKLTPDGRRLLRASKLGEATVLYERSKKDRFSLWDSSTFFFNMFIDYVYGIWEDRLGRVYLGVYIVENSKSLNLIVVLDPERNEELGRAELFVQEMPHEIHRSIRVSPDGHIFQMALDKRGVFMKRYGLTK